MKVILRFPGEKIIEVDASDIDEALVRACRATGYKYEIAMDARTKAFTKCECVKCLDACPRGDERCWWHCRCGPCANPFTGDC